MDVSYQLVSVNFPSESSPLPSLCIELTLFGYVTGSNQCLYPLYHMSLRELITDIHKTWLMELEQSIPISEIKG